MALSIRPNAEPFLSAAEIAHWRDVPASIIGDELNRTSVMDGGMQPLGEGRSFAGLALTVDCMAGDNSALHYALSSLAPGQVIVADGHRHIDTALWGSIMHTCAKARGAAAVVIDGAMRDRAEVVASGLPAYVRGVCPRGPHKHWGGSINGPIQCGGVPIAPGDLIVGDADGVAVVRPDQIAGLLERCRRRVEREKSILAEVAIGKTTVEVLGLPPPERIGT